MAASKPSKAVLLITQMLTKNMEEIEKIWDYLGLEPDERGTRIFQINSSLTPIFSQIIEQENRYRQELEQQVEQEKKNLDQLTQLLKEPSFLPPRNLSTSALLRLVRQKIADFEQKRKEAIGQYHEDIRKICTFKRKLAMPPNSSGEEDTVDNSNVDETRLLNTDLPDESERSLVTAELDQLTNKYATLFREYFACRTDIARISTEIQFDGISTANGAINQQENAVADAQLIAESIKPLFCLFPQKKKTADNKSPREDLELPESHDLQALLKRNIDSSDCPVIDANMLERMRAARLLLVKKKTMLVGRCGELRRSLQRIYTRLTRIWSAAELSQSAGIDASNEDIDLQSGGNITCEVLQRLENELARCQNFLEQNAAKYRQGLEQQYHQLAIQCFEQPETATASIPSLKDMSSCDLEQSLDRLEGIYAKNRVLFEALESYRSVWRQYAEVEMRMRDPAILSNRGGILLKTEKEKKRLQKELPKAEQEARKAVQNAAAAQQDQTPFLIGGRQTFDEFVAELSAELGGSWDTRGSSAGGGSSVNLRPGTAGSSRASSRGPTAFDSPKRNSTSNAMSSPSSTPNPGATNHANNRVK